MDVGFHFSLDICRNEIAGLYGNSMCNFMRNYQTVFQSAYIVLQFLQQLTRAPVSLHAKLVVVCLLFYPSLSD